MSDTELKARFKAFVARFKGQGPFIERMQVAILAKDVEGARQVTIDMLTSTLEIMDSLKGFPGCDQIGEQIRVTRALRDAYVSGNEVDLAIAMAEGIGMSFVQACGLLKMCEEMVDDLPDGGEGD